MIIWDPIAGRHKVSLTHGEFMDLYHRWQQKPETRAMFAKIAQERKERVAQIMAQIGAQKGRE